MLLTEPATNVTIKQSATSSRLRILVLCTGNSARSIMAEAILNTLGAPLFQAFSAGSRPAGKVNPLALEQIGQLNLPEDMIVRSKSWEEFTKPDAPKLDLVLTVCDNAASEACPVFMGDYARVHWQLADPAGSSDQIEDERKAFAECFAEIRTRVESLAVLSGERVGKRAVIAAMEKWS